MEGLKATYREFRPIIWVLWAVAAVRLVMDAAAAGKEHDQNVAFMVSVYAGSAILFLHNGITGAMDHVGWKRLLGGCVVVTVLCWSIPNGISYSVAQFAGWTHGRFYVDPEEYALLEKYQAEGMGVMEAMDKVKEDLDRWTTRGDPPQDTTGGKLGVGLKMMALTGIAGVVWNLAVGSLLLGVPMSLRRRRGS